MTRSIGTAHSGHILSRFDAVIEMMEIESLLIITTPSDRIGGGKEVFSKSIIPKPTMSQWRDPV